jgi:multicomponent Na+:H+ antiporter subunit D
MLLRLLPVLAVILPVISSCIIAVWGKRFFSQIAIITAFLNALLVISLYLTGRGSPAAVNLFEVNEFLSVEFRVDPLGLYFGLLVSILWVFTAFYASGYMSHGEYRQRFFVFFTLCLGITLGIAFAGNLFTFYLFYELLTLGTYPLVIHKESSESLAAGKKYLIYSFSGAALVLMAIITTFAISGSINFAPGGIFGRIYPGIELLFMAFFIGFGVKAAVVPLHSWLPSAMVAPTPVSALLHAVAVVKSGIFAIIRITYYIFGNEILVKTGINKIALTAASLTILLGSSIALTQKNLKKRLAYSTVSQLSYILLGIFLFSRSGFTGGLMHVVNHAVLKITLFFCAGSILVMTGKSEVSQLKGIGKDMPITMLCFTIASVGLTGIPPTNGFVSKWYLSIGSLETGRVLYIVILLISALLTACYLFPVSVNAFFSQKEDSEKFNEPPGTMLIPIVILTVTGLALGIFPSITKGLIDSIVSIFY